VTDHTDLLARLDAAEARMAALALDPPPGLTDADPATGEQWDAGQAWAHVAEFVPFWQGETEKVVTAYAGEPVPFGRSKDDPGRVGYIRENRNEPPGEQMARLAGALMLFRQYLATLSNTDWSARGACCSPRSRPPRPRRPRRPRRRSSPSGVGPLCSPDSGLCCWGGCCCC